MASIVKGVSEADLPHFEVNLRAGHPRHAIKSGVLRAATVLHAVQPGAAAEGLAVYLHGGTNLGKDRSEN